MLHAASIPPARARAPRFRLDLPGAAVSCACACHCIARRAVVALVPALGPERLLGGSAETGHLAAWRARAARGRWSAMAPFAVGVWSLVGSRVLEARGVDGFADGPVLAGAGLLAAAHPVDRRRTAGAPTAEPGVAGCPRPDGRIAR